MREPKRAAAPLRRGGAARRGRRTSGSRRAPGPRSAGRGRSPRGCRAAATAGNSRRAVSSTTVVLLRTLSISSRPTRRVERRHQAQPEAREPRGQDRHRDHRAAAGRAGARTRRMMSQVGDAVGAADLDDRAAARARGRARATRYAIRSSIAMRLGGLAHPARRDHDRQLSPPGARTISNERLPEPMTIEARSSSVGTPDSRRMRPTSWRLRRWRESPGSRPRPPR